MKGEDGFDVEDEYDRFRRRQHIHRMHLVGYVVSAALGPKDDTFYHFEGLDITKPVF